MSLGPFWVTFWGAFLAISVGAFAVMSLLVSVTAWGDLKRLLRRSADRPAELDGSTSRRAEDRSPPA